MIRNVNQDRNGMIWLATARGLARYNPANGETARFLHNESDEASLSTNARRSKRKTALSGWPRARAWILLTGKPAGSRSIFFCATRSRIQSVEEIRTFDFLRTIRGLYGSRPLGMVLRSSIASAPNSRSWRWPGARISNPALGRFSKTGSEHSVDRDRRRPPSARSRSRTICPLPQRSYRSQQLAC